METTYTLKYPYCMSDNLYALKVSLLCHHYCWLKFQLHLWSFGKHSLISSIFDIRMDRFKSNQTLKFSPFLDILYLNEGNLKRVNGSALKFYTFKIQSVSYIRVRSKITISYHMCVLLRVKGKRAKNNILKIKYTHIYLMM